jgi:putative acetyltransferase
MALIFTIEEPTNTEVLTIIAAHLAFARETTPEEHVHALDASGVSGPTITLFGAREEGILLGIGALRELDPTHGELKSMHVLKAARGRGVGRGMVAHLLTVARERGYARVSLETGTHEGFNAARAMYSQMGFSTCPPFGDYAPHPGNTFMSMELRPAT